METASSSSTDAGGWEGVRPGSISNSRAGRAGRLGDKTKGSEPDRRKREETVGSAPPPGDRQTAAALTGSGSAAGAGSAAGGVARPLTGPGGVAGAAAEAEAKAWKTIWSAGHGVTSITDCPSVKDLVKNLKSEFINSVKKQSELLENF